MASRTRRRNKSGHISPYFQRRQRYEAVLRPLGLWESFQRMPRHVQEQFWQHKFPDPILEFDASFPGDQEHRMLRKELESAFRAAFVEFDAPSITIRDFFSVVAGLKFTVEGTRHQIDAPDVCAKFLHDAWPLLDCLYEHYLPAVWPSLHRAVIVPLVGHSRLDARLLTATCRCESTANGKYVIKMVVGANEPQMRRVQIYSVSRTVYRVATTNEWEGVRWLSWNAAHLREADLKLPGDEYPVYVQSHALRQLHKRLNLMRMAPYLEAWMTESLANPCIVERYGTDLLVEYRLREHRLGYLVVTLLKDLVAVRTFKSSR